MATTKAITLTAEQQQQLENFINGGEALARHIKHANVLLKLAEGWSQAHIAQTFLMSERNIIRIKQRFLQEGLEAVLQDKPRSGAPQKFGGDTRATVSTIACSEPPQGQARWHLRLIADRVVELEIAESISHQTVGNMLAANQLKPWQKQEWCIPSISAEFVAPMEDILDVYARPYDPAYPVVCLDESAKELQAQVCQSLPMQPGQPEREDTEYVHNGRTNFFLAVEPLRGWRGIHLTQRRTARDYAEFIQYLVDEVYPNAEEIQIVQDNLNTHCPASLYKRYAPEEALRILRKVRFHYTPKHGSWLNMAEIEIGIYKRQCLDRRLESLEVMERETEAWVNERNQRGEKIKWEFTCEKARSKLARLYPKLEELGAEAA